MTTTKDSDIDRVAERLIKSSFEDVRQAIIQLNDDWSRSGFDYNYYQTQFTQIMKFHNWDYSEYLLVRTERNCNG